MATKLQLALQHLQPAVKAFKEGIMPSSGPGCGIMFERCDGQDCTRWMRPRALACAYRRSGSTSEGSKQHAATDRFPWVHALHGRGIIAQTHRVKFTMSGTLFFLSTQDVGNQGGVACHAGCKWKTSWGRHGQRRSMRLPACRCNKCGTGVRRVGSEKQA